jgi:gluconate:H+ symporter, GntP family
MRDSLYYPLVCLLVGIGVIILLTTKYRVHAFFALILAAFITGFGLGLPVVSLIADVKEGFGNIMKSLGIIIVLGTTLGSVLEFTGSTRVMAAFILKKTGQRRAGLAMSITGFIVGLPVFCDSGYIVLSGLNRPLARRTGIPLATICTSLATGLYAVHCLIPPHPGAAAAAGNLGVDLGRLIVFGIAVAIPGMLIGHWWSIYAGKKIADSSTFPEEPISEKNTGPSVTKAFLPIILPILLIALKSFLSIAHSNIGPFLNILNSAGDPVIALSVGVLLAFYCGRDWNRSKLAMLLQESAEKAGGILVIIGAGGAFGAVLSAADLGKHFSEVRGLASLGIVFPFLVSFLLKTAQGSSTVAIITAASIVQPLLPALGLDSDTGKLLAVLSMGAGSMMISHGNDAYFWVISKFSGLDMRTMLKLYSVATIFMGLVTFLVIYILSLFLS